MLPTSGFFKDIECPFLENGCDRPYCHFRHRKKAPEVTDAAKEETTEVEIVPTYNPTPISQLANTRSHIPIKYVPDLAGLSERSGLRKMQLNKLPTYKPTPLSQLGNVVRVSSTVAEDGAGGSEETSRYTNITINYPTTEYNPNEPLKTEDIDFEDLSNEFEMIDEIIKEEEPAEKKESVEKKERKSSGGHSKKHDKKEDKSTREKSSRSSHHRKHRESSEKKKSDDKHKSHTSSSKHRDKERSSRDSKKHRDDKKIASSSKHKEKSTSSKEKHESNNKKAEPSNKTDDDCDVDTYLDDIDVNFDSEEETLEECYRIFNEYKPEEPQIQRDVVVLPKKDEEQNVGKKRVAHEKADRLPTKAPPPPTKRPLDAGLVMTNRFKIARLAQANNEQKRLAEAMKKPPPPPPQPQLNHKKPHKPKESSTSLIDEILTGAAAPKPIKRIAPVQNVNLMQRAKAKIEEMARQKAVLALQKTQAQTISKGAQRVAHVPEYSLADIPDVLHADKSKLPVNVRTRYLTMIADECVKLYAIKDDAYQRALNEEFKCYERCKV